MKTVVGRRSLVVGRSLLDVGATLVAVLREIFDEAPYARFLRRTGMIQSRESYAAFLKETHLARASRPRCC